MVYRILEKTFWGIVLTEKISNSALTLKAAPLALDEGTDDELVYITGGQREEIDLFDGEKFRS